MNCFLFRKENWTWWSSSNKTRTGDVTFCTQTHYIIPNRACRRTSVAGMPDFFLAFPEVFFLCACLFFFFCLDAKEKRNKKKKSRLRLRGYCGTAVLALKNELASLKQHFSAPSVHSSAHAPPPRPIFFFANALRCLKLRLFLCPHRYCKAWAVLHFKVESGLTCRMRTVQANLLNMP